MSKTVIFHNHFLTSSLLCLRSDTLKETVSNALVGNSGSMGLQPRSAPEITIPLPQLLCGRGNSL